MIHQVAAIASTLQAEKRLKEAKKKLKNRKRPKNGMRATDENDRMK